MEAKAISLWQPWASAIAIGSKKIETRSWKTKYRGPLIIHAGKKWGKNLRATAQLLHKKDVPLPIDEDGQGLPLGFFVCLVDLVDCIEMTAKWIKKQKKTQRLLGDYRPGRYGWILENVRVIDPVPALGQQRLWTVTNFNPVETS